MSTDLQARVDQLMEEARAHLANDRLLEAVLIARELRRLRYSGTFEIRALALGKAGRSAAALAVLRRGVARTPNAWMVQMMLANALSDFRRYGEAFEAYAAARALAVDPCDQVLIEGNHAHALRRAGQGAAAVKKAAWCLEVCGANDIDEDLRDFVRSVHAGALEDGRPRRRRLFDWRR